MAQCNNYDITVLLRTTMHNTGRFMRQAVISIVNSQGEHLSNTQKEQNFLLENGQFKIKKPEKKGFQF